MSEYLPTDIQKYIHISKYSRWRHEWNRRETWEETVDRYIDFWKKQLGDSIPENIYDEIRENILTCKVMPSMRTMMTAGKALERDHIAGFNCTACAITHPAVFSEAFYILMNGCGFGFSVERQYINKLPEVAEELYPTETTIIVRDSKIGWATALKELISMLYNGQIPKWDLSKIRPAGAILKTFGGRASGPQALDTLLKQVINVFQGAKGRKLTSIECHDIICYIAEAVIVGSVRRSATISMSNLTDDRMRRAKDGQWWFTNPQRAMANNSVAYTEKPDIDAFSKEWRTLYKSKSGERGIWNKVSARKKAEESGREVEGHDFITNPCFIGNMRLLTCNGYESFENLADKEDIYIVNENGFVVPSNVWYSGEKEVVELRFRNREPIICTPDHVFKTIDGNTCEAKDLKNKILKPFDLKADINDFEVISIEKLDGKHKVYDFSEPQSHWGVVEGVIAHNCGETILRDTGSACVSGNTLLISKNGLTTIKDSVGKNIEIWNGDKWSTVTPFKTGSDRELYRVYLSDGTYIDVTDDHRWSVKDRFMKEWKEIKTSELDSFSKYSVQVEDTYILNQSKKKLDGAYTLGFMVGDGSYCYKIGDGRKPFLQSKLSLFGAKIDCPVGGKKSPVYTNEKYNCDIVDVTGLCGKYSDKLGYRIKYEDGIDELFEYSRESILEFFAGWIDSDGSNTGGNGVRLYISDREKSYKSLLLLKKNGINCSLNLCHSKNNDSNYGVRNHDLYYLQITDCVDIPCHRVDTSKGCKPKYKGKYQNIRKIEKLEGTHDTFCLEEQYNHKCVFGSVLTFQCNLSEVIIRPDDDFDTIKDKIRIATIIGTMQATLTNFRFLRKIWKNNIEEERLLGVSLTGIMDHIIFSKQGTKEDYMKWTGDKFHNLNDLLSYFHDYTHEVNKEYAKKLGIPSTGHCTVVKPSGTVSILTGTSSGIHPRYGKYYIRRVRNDKKDPLSQLMIDEGIPYVEEGEKYVFSFYVKSPDHSVIQEDIGAMQQLDVWKSYKIHWCDGNPSQTIYYTDDDYFAIADWLWSNWDIVGGISFFPHSGSDYPNAPLEQITEEEYNKGMESFPKNIRWDRLSEYEKIDTTTSSQEVACAGGACEL